MSSQHILIIGAGICGLSLAQGLQKAGIKYTLFEAEEESTFRPREWSMALHWSLPMLEMLLPDNLAARIKIDSVVDPSLDYTEYPNDVIPVFDGVSGALMREIPNFGIRVSRRKLRTLCSEGVHVEYGHTLTSVEYNADDEVTAVFANGKSYTGTLLVGTDGPRSFVRKHIFGTQAANTPLDVTYTNVAFGYGDPEKSLFVREVNPVTAMMVHPDSCALISIQDVPDPEEPKDWVFRLIMMWNDTEHDMCPEVTKIQVLERAEKLHEPFRSAFLWMPESVETRRYGLGYWIPPTEDWDTRKGRVTLAGDAAHSMPPHRGQGLNNAINDAFNLVAAISELDGKNQSELIQLYSEEVAERGAKEVKLSKETAAMMLDYTTFQQSALMTKGLEKA